MPRLLNVGRQPYDGAEATLKRLRVHSFVELTSHSDGEWRLVVTKRVGGYAARTYVGSLSSVLISAIEDAPAILSR